MAGKNPSPDEVAAAFVEMNQDSGESLLTRSLNSLGKPIIVYREVRVSAVQIRGKRGTALVRIESLGASPNSQTDTPLDLYCIGGFVICYCYGLPRPTGDIDYYSAVPANLNLIEMAGEGSALFRKYKIQLHHVTVTNLLEDYATRLTEMFPRVFKNLRLFAPDHFDFILSKLERNSAKDRDDADYIFKTRKLSPQILRERYEKELRPYLSKESWHDDPLELWIEIFEKKNCMVPENTR